MCVITTSFNSYNLQLCVTWLTTCSVRVCACVTVWMSQLDACLEAWLRGRHHNLMCDCVDTTTWLRKRRNIAVLGFSSCCNCLLPTPTTWSVTTVCGHHHLQLICDCVYITLSDLTTYMCDPGKNVWFTGEGHASSGGSKVTDLQKRFTCI